MDQSQLKAKFNLCGECVLHCRLVRTVPKVMNPALRTPACYHLKWKVTTYNDANTARFWRHRQLQNLSAVDAEIVQLRSLGDVPEADGEVDGS